MPKVSVVIPTYNRANYICSAIDSVLGQTYQDFEIIIIDDGSTDNTEDIIDGYVSKYPTQIRYFYQFNQGEGAARNRGIKESEGEYIAFLDSDDFWLKGKLEIQVGILDGNQEIALTYCYAKRIDEHGNMLDMKPTKPALKPGDFLDGGRLSMMTVFFRKKAIEEVGPFEKGMKVGTDTDMWLRFSLKHKIHFLDKPLAIMRAHSGNISNSQEEMHLGHMKILRKLLNGRIKNPFRKKAIKNLLAREYYLLGRVYYKQRNADLALKYSLRAIRHSPLVGKRFIAKEQSAFGKIKRYINPYGLVGISLLKRYGWGKTKPGSIKNILYFEPSSGYGGSGNSLFSLLAHLDWNKFRPIVVTFNDGPQFEKVKKLGVEVIKLNSKPIESKRREGIASYGKFGLDVLLNIFPVVFKLKVIIKRHNVDLVHINTDILSGIPAILAAKIAGIGCIGHIRITRELIRREKVLSRWMDKYIVLNRQALKMYQRYLDKDKLVLIYDGIEPSESLADNGRGLREEFKIGVMPIVGLVGRVVEGKGHKEFILAARQVLNTMPEVKFVIVGDGQGDNNSNKYLTEVKDLVASENLDKDVLFTGWRNDIMNVIGGLNILVQATAFPEGFGLTCIEAMSLSKPVVATNIPGPSEIVVDGETGFLVPPGNPAALAGAILKLLNHPDLARKMGEAGRKRAAQYFDIRKTARAIETIYTELLSEKND